MLAGRGERRRKRGKLAARSGEKREGKDSVNTFSQLWSQNQVLMWEYSWPNSKV